jgi:2-succinyl-5-enolpyruvyl-6-hydroxy-3-cyclohexene-1-carboxylate synthase
MISTHPASLNQLWAQLLIEVLIRNGIKHLCLAPGSRSTPLVMAADQRPELELHHHFDERGLGFLALGLAKGSGQTAALVTTSGTAVANLYPAVIEAAQSGVRLLVISADRPPRLHGCGANQAIEQQAIFANYPRASLYLPPPSDDYPVLQLVTEIHQVVTTISDTAGGVAHINCMYDEPLYPGSQQIDCSDYLAPLHDWLRQIAAVAPITRDSATATAVLPQQPDWQAFCSAPGLVIAGALDAEDARQAKQLAKQLGWPLLADIQSQLCGDPQVLNLTDMLLVQPDSRQLLDQASHLLQLGGRLVSKRLQAFIEQQPWQQFWLVNPGPTALAPGRNQHRFFSCKVSDWQPAPAADKSDTSNTGEQLLGLQAKLELRCHRQCEEGKLNELRAGYRLLHSGSAANWLLAGNSLSIRLLDLVAGPNSQVPLIYANRGASGIEGLVSTALGISRVRQQPGCLLLGDYSLLFDLNTLALLRDHIEPLAVVVLNNDGGGIFRMLPVADEALRQRHYQRPHGLHFEQACRLFEIGYHQPTTLDQLVHCYDQALSQPGASLIEVIADARDTEQQLQALIAAAGH